MRGRSRLWGNEQGRARESLNIHGSRCTMDCVQSGRGQSGAVGGDRATEAVHKTSRNNKGRGQGRFGVRGKAGEEVSNSGLLGKGLSQSTHTTCSTQCWRRELRRTWLYRRVQAHASVRDRRGLERRAWWRGILGVGASFLKIGHANGTQVM
jgi:hypothetical protein